jgi:hypothetical protein
LEVALVVALVVAVVPARGSSPSSLLVVLASSLHQNVQINNLHLEGLIFKKEREKRELRKRVATHRSTDHIEKIIKKRIFL